MESLGGLLKVDWNFDDTYYWAGIKDRVHLHDSDPRFGIAAPDGPLNGGRAAMTGQYGGVNVQAAETPSGNMLV